jgi:regulator of nonsense transcripts 2
MQLNSRLIYLYFKIRLAELINLPQPILPEDDSIPTQSDSFVTGGDSSRLSAHKLTPTDLGPWDDEESKNFYTDILDIKLMVPGILLEGGTVPVQIANFTEDKQDDSEAENADLESKSAIQGENSSDMAQPDLNVKSSASIDSDPSANQASSPLPSSNSIKSAQLETLIAKLNNMANRDLINEIAVEFCYMNTKSNRARLIQALFGVNRLRLDLIPYYCRLLATLNPYFPEITQGVLTSLANEFKSFRRRKATQGYEFRESRIKNIRYISELTKFGLAPPHDTFHCFKVLLEDMTNASNLETLCSMLDCCGRFLYKTPDTHERTSAMVIIYILHFILLLN